MRRRCLAPTAGVLALLAAGCSTGPTQPPSGLPVTIGMAAGPAGAAPAPVITGAGDSVVAVAVLNTLGCYDYGAAAGTATGGLVLTITGTEANRACPVSPATVRVVARQVPPGRYDVVLRQRAVTRARTVTSIELARQSVTLP